MKQEKLSFSPQDLSRLGGGILAYVKEIASGEARGMLGAQVALPPSQTLFCLYNADGTPLSISATREAALGSAMEHDLTPASVH